MTTIILDSRPDTHVGFSAATRTGAVAERLPRDASTRPTRLICAWHHTTEGRLVCAWKQVSADELGALELADGHES